MPVQKPLDAFARMDTAVVEEEYHQGLGKGLMELVEKGDESPGRPARRSFPVDALGPAMQGPENRRPLAFEWGDQLVGLADGTPRPLHIGLIGEVRFILEEDLYRGVREGLDVGDELADVRFFSAGVGPAGATTALARLKDQAPALRARRTVESLTSWAWA